ncbi:hypothetical protein ACFO9Q_19385 [Paenibacillus sp. GCM10023252]|uniref:hypothetical protein n=1 Tax=Paenibacillus sp. GCM10023252 TaxID=3252649 RepID=UPI00360F5A31
MAVYTTGLITNTRTFGTAASDVVVNSHNLGAVDVTVIVEVFGASPSSPALTPLYIIGFDLPAGMEDTRSFFIAGNLTYEVQISNTSSVFNEVIHSTFGVNEFLNLTHEQRVLHTELVPIAALTVPV